MNQMHFLTQSCVELEFKSLFIARVGIQGVPKLPRINYFVEILN